MKCGYKLCLTIIWNLKLFYEFSFLGIGWQPWPAGQDVLQVSRGLLRPPRRTYNSVSSRGSMESDRDWWKATHCRRSLVPANWTKGWSHQNQIDCPNFWWSHRYWNYVSEKISNLLDYKLNISITIMPLLDEWIFIWTVNHLQSILLFLITKLSIKKFLSFGSFVVSLSISSTRFLACSRPTKSSLQIVSRITLSSGNRAETWSTPVLVFCGLLHGFMSTMMTDSTRSGQSVANLKMKTYVG